MVPFDSRAVLVHWRSFLKSHISRVQENSGGYEDHAVGDKHAHRMPIAVSPNSSADLGVLAVAA